MKRVWFYLVWLLLFAQALWGQVTISNVYVSASTSTTATIVWTTSGPATSQIRYGFDSTMPYANTQNPALVTSHSMTLTVLSNSQPLYYFAAVSVDSAGHITTGATMNFSLCGAPLVPMAGTANDYYIYGSYTLTWVPPAGSSGTPTVCGNAMATTLSGSLDGGASFSNDQVADAYKVIPGPGTWTVHVQDPGNIAPVQFNYPLSAVSNNVSTPLKVLANASGLINCQVNTLTSAAYPSLCGGGGASLCGPLAGDATSTNCGNNNLASPPTGTNYLQAFGDNNLNTDTGSRVVASGTGNVNTNALSEVVALGDTNISSVTTPAGNADWVAIGNANAEVVTEGSDGSDMVLVGEANGQNIAYLNDSVGIGLSNFQHNAGTSISDALSESVAIGLANDQYVNSGDTVIGIGQSAAGGCSPTVAAEICSGASGSDDLTNIIGIGDTAAGTVGSNSDDIIAIGSALPGAAGNSSDIIAIGDGTDNQCVSSGGFTCAQLHKPNPVATSEVIALGTTAAAYNQASNVFAAGLATLGGGRSINIDHSSVLTPNSGSFNLAAGDYALVANTTGANNVAVGPYAGGDGYSLSGLTYGNSNQTGSNNTWIGYDSGPNTTTQLTNTIALGYQAHNGASNQTVIGNSSITSLKIFGCPTGQSALDDGSGTCYVPGSSSFITSLTTTGTSGPATVVSGVLNIPQYSGGGGAVSSVTNSDGTLTISPTTGAVVASLALGHANTWTALQTSSAGINLSGTTSPLQLAGSAGTSGNCLLSAGSGATPTWGSCGSGSGISGLTAGYIPIAGSATTITANSHIDDGVTTASTLTATEPIAITGSTHGLTIAAGTAVSGATGKVIYASDATNGYAEVNENNTGLSRVCTVANGLCTGSTGVSSFTGDGALLSNSASTGAVTATLANAAAHKFWGNNTGSTAAPGYETIGTADLPGSGATTVNGVTCTLGSTCTVTAPLYLNWTFNSGAAATDAAPRFLASHAATISTCYALTTASDAATALTFNIFDNGTTIFSGGAQTIAAATSPGTLTTLGALATTSISNNDKFSINITSGTSSWIFTVQCK